jgi:type I site-specific restriction-modification system R (restriction) subunit
LRQQNEHLRAELVAYERSFDEQLNIALRQKQLELTRVWESKIGHLQGELNKQMQESKEEESSRQHLRTYEKYIDNLEKNREELSS